MPSADADALHRYIPEPFRSEYADSLTLPDCCQAILRKAVWMHTAPLRHHHQSSHPLRYRLAASYRDGDDPFLRYAPEQPAAHQPQRKE